MSASVRCLLAAIVVTFLSFGLAQAQGDSTDDNPKGFTERLNVGVVKRVKVAIATRANSNQSEAPSASSNSTSLVDTSSASDLVGMALNLAGLTASNADSNKDNDTNTGMVTASAYVLWAAARGVNPLDPTEYCRKDGPVGPAAWWRRVSFTLGFDDEQHKDTGEKSPVVAGAKAILWTERDVCDADFKPVRDALVDAATAVSIGSKRLEDEWYQRWHDGQLQAGEPSYPGACTPEALQKALGTGMKCEPTDTACIERRCRIVFLGRLNDDTILQSILKQVGMETPADALSDDELERLVNLDLTARQAIDRFRSQPQLSASFTTKQRSDGLDEYRTQVVFDYGLNDRLTFTGNASWEIKDGKDTEKVQHGQGGRMAAQLQFEPFKDPLFGPKTLRVSLGAEAGWSEQDAPTYKGQLKVNLPIPKVAWLTGVELPLSITVANRSDLVNETEVRGLVGFTVDTAQLLHTLQ